MPLPIQIVIMFFYFGKFEQSVLWENPQKIDAQKVMMNLNYRIFLWDFYFLFSERQRAKRVPIALLLWTTSLSTPSFSVYAL